jgi:hypothetical protein
VLPNRAGFGLRDQPWRRIFSSQAMRAAPAAGRGLDDDRNPIRARCRRLVDR